VKFRKKKKKKKKKFQNKTMSLSLKEREWLERLVLEELKLGHRLREIVSRTDEGFSNENYEVHTDWGGCFCKLNREVNLFEAESHSLAALGAVVTKIKNANAEFSLRVPAVKGRGVLPPAVFGATPGGYIVLEHVYMRDVANNPKDQAALGAALAELHSAAPAQSAADGKTFGFEAPTYLGGMRLDNEWADDWWHFFTHRRLAPVFKIAADRYRDRALSALWRRLQIAIPRLFSGDDKPKIVASLLHGDLSPLNASSYELKLGKWAPCLFDPAAFYGHAEFDLALSRLEGMEQYQFHPSFYEAYFAAKPKTPGFDLREKVYVLYHALNHHNVYGTAYGDFKGQVLRLGDELLAALPEPIADPGPQAGDAELEWDRIEAELERKQRAAEAKLVPEFGEAFKTVEEPKKAAKKFDDSDDSSESKPETALPKFVAPVLPRATELRERSANADDSSSSSDDEKPVVKPAAAETPAAAAPAAEESNNAFASIFAAVDDDNEDDKGEGGGEAAIVSPRSTHKSPRHSSKLKKSSKTKAKSMETKTEREEMKTEVDLDAEFSPRKSGETLVSPRSREKRRHHKSNKSEKEK
jgi:fructosamine-3-kinase